MNEGMFNHIMEAFDALGKRLDRMIALMEQTPSRDTSTPPDEAIVQVDEETAAKMEPDFEPVHKGSQPTVIKDEWSTGAHTTAPTQEPVKLKESSSSSASGWMADPMTSTRKPVNTTKTRR